MKAYVFPGQGSQKVGMGEGLFEKYPEIVEICDRVLGYSIVDLCTKDEENKLGLTQYTQPALYTVNAMHYYEKVKEEGRPAFVAGHSLGEYNALLAAEVFDFETGLKLVKQRGYLMSQARGGGMAAVLNFSEENIKRVLREHNLDDKLFLANYNSPTQIVIAGEKDAVAEAKPYFEEAGARSYVPLKVSGAFHSPLMEDAKNEFRKTVEQADFKAPVIPVIANCTARPYKMESINETLIEQMTSCVKWTDIECYILSHDDVEIEQVGPGDVLTGLLRQINRAIRNGDVVLQKPEEQETKTVHMTNDDVKQESNFVNQYPYGSKEFMETYDLRYPYVVGGMYHGISSVEMVVNACKAGFLAFYGAGGLEAEQVESAIQAIKSQLGHTCFGVNLIHNVKDSNKEKKMVDLLLKYEVKLLEVSSYINVTSALARYKIKGLQKDPQGNVISTNRIMAKLSRPEVAENFLLPIPKKIIEELYRDGMITSQEAEMAKQVPIADEVTVEADSAGHTDGKNAAVLWPALIRACKRIINEQKYPQKINIGVAGGIGTPEAVACAFMLGADYIVTGSINQCTVEAGTSKEVKELLQKIDVQDTGYAPAGDMFELGETVQVLKRGVFFPVRANKLYDLYRNYDSIESLGVDLKEKIEKKYFHKTFNDIIEESIACHQISREEFESMNDKMKMSFIFKWYFAMANKAALDGDKTKTVDYQVYCGPALGAFNQYVKGMDIESWEKRHIDGIAKLLMDNAIVFMEK